MVPLELQELLERMELEQHQELQEILVVHHLFLLWV
jgi:hypothetical protein